MLSYYYRVIHKTYYLTIAGNLLRTDILLASCNSILITFAFLGKRLLIGSQRAEELEPGQEIKDVTIVIETP